MNQSAYDSIFQAITSGSIEQLEEVAHSIQAFPDGKNATSGTHWISFAVEHGTKDVVIWMLTKTVDLSFRDDEGWTVLLSALARRKPDRYAILELLLQHHAPLDLQGLNDWTPAHMAAALDDVEALKLLARYGADFSIRTRIDNYATPLEEARRLQKQAAVKYLEQIKDLQTNRTTV